MFDVGWIELGFIAVLALLVVGPKDLPKLLKVVGSVVSKARKLYRQVLAGVNTLDREIQVSSGQVKKDSDTWRNYVPESVRNLPDDFLPGSMSPEQHAQRRAAFRHARESVVSGEAGLDGANSTVADVALPEDSRAAVTQDVPAQSVISVERI